jgi:hypothetical protein
VFRSTDRGQSFGLLGFTKHTESLAIQPGATNTLYAGGHCLFTSQDQGISWTSALLGTYIETDSVVVDPLQPETVFVGAHQGGVYRSVGGGTGWVRMMDDVGLPEIRALALDRRNPQTLYVGTSRYGIWKYTFGPASRRDYSVSIDSAAPSADSTDVTLKLTARLGTTQMMISNDGGFAGATWEPFASQKDWTLETYDGAAAPATVYAKFWTFGEVSGLYQDDIVVVTGGSVGGATSPATGAVLPRARIVLSGALAVALGGAGVWLRRRTGLA